MIFSRHLLAAKQIISKESTNYPLYISEFGCLPYGLIYYVTIPSMYLLLVIFSIYNLNDVSWGTREVAADAVSFNIKSILL